MKRITVVTISMLMVCFCIFYYQFFSKKNNFEQQLINQIVADNQIGKIYELETFLKPYKYDYVDFKHGFDIESKHGFEKIVFIKDDKKVKIYYTEMIGVGDLRKKQLFIKTDGIQIIHRCKPNAQIKVVNIDNDSELYEIKPLKCKTYQ